MFYIILIGSLCVVIPVGVIILCNKFFEYEGFTDFVGLMMGVIIILSTVTTPIVAYEWKAAERKTEIINANSGTNYTTGDVFFAGDTIVLTQEGTKHNIIIKDD